MNATRAALQSHSSLPEMPHPIPVTVISGFLGAGKTTLLNHILSQTHGVRAGVLVNDFGAVNIDARLVIGVEGETVELVNGCVCCSIRDDMLTACIDMLHRKDPPDYLVIESSGVSNPAQLANTLRGPELRQLVVIDSILTIVDAAQFANLRGTPAVTARMQVAAADIVVVNKVDLVSISELEDTKRRVLDMAPGSQLVQATRCQVPEPLFWWHNRQAGYSRRSKQNVSGDSPSCAASNSHLDTFHTWSWSCESQLSLPMLRLALSHLPETIYRSKGILYLEELPGYRVLLQMVGKRIEFIDIGPWENDAPRSEIVMIGADDSFNIDQLSAALDACIGTGNASLSPILRLSRKLGLTGLPAQ